MNQPDRRAPKAEQIVQFREAIRDALRRVPKSFPAWDRAKAAHYKAAAAAARAAADANHPNLARLIEAHHALMTYYREQ